MKIKCICKICNKEFYRKETEVIKVKTLYCSRECFKKGKTLKNIINIFENYAEIPINSKKYGLQKIKIDIEDIEKVKNIRWMLTKNHGNIYAHSSKKYKSIKMHRFITNCPNELVVHHKNHNTLDNRKENLEICTMSENSKDKKKGNT